MAILQLIAEEEKSLCFDFLEEKIREESRKLIESIYASGWQKSYGEIRQQNSATICPKDTDGRNIDSGTAKATEAMAFKLCRQAEKNWRRLKGFEKLDLVAKDMKFENGVLKEVA